MKKLLIPLVILALVMFATSVVKRTCEKGECSIDPRRAAAGRSDQLYVEVSALGNLDYFYDHKLGLKTAGEMMGVRTEYVGPAEYDIPAMITAFEQALAKPNLKGILVVGFEDSLIPVINKAVEQGVPVITLDADLPKSKRLAFVGTGNYNAGYQGGEKLAELIGRRGKVAIMTRAGQSNLDERIRGYREALGKYGGIQIVQVIDTQSDAVISAQAATAVLRKYPDLAGIACVEAAGGVGAAIAASEAGVAGKLKIVAMDRGNDILEQIGKGVISATVVQQTALMPIYGVQILYNLANSKIPITSDNAKAGVTGIPASVDTGVVIVDKSNYEYFLRK